MRDNVSTAWIEEWRKGSGGGGVGSVDGKRWKGDGKGIGIGRLQEKACSGEPMLKKEN